MMTERPAGRPVFKKYGGVYQLLLEKPEDLDHLHELEEGRWMATSCPLFGLRLDPAFHQLLDANNSGRIISDEVCAAVRWLRERLRPAASWTGQQPRVALDLIDQTHPDGPGLLDAARYALAELGQEGAAEISLDQVRAYQQKVAQFTFNGDGVVPPETILDPEAAQFARDLIGALGGVTDASGKPGVDEEMLDRFQKEAQAFLQWRVQGAIPEGATATPIMPCGEQTPEMFAALSRGRDKVEEFFAQCALVRFDPGMAECMGLRDEERAQLDYTDPQAIRGRLQRAPLADPNPEGILPLAGSRINEAFRDQVEVLRIQVAVPVFGTGIDVLTEKRWRELRARFAAYEAWLKSKPVTTLEALEPDKLRICLESPHAQTIRALAAEDRKVAGKVQKLQELEKLILLHQWLFVLVNNFVSFPYLFDLRRAMFEMGTLVLEGKEFNFSIQVENRAIHANLAKNSGIFLLYLQVTGPQPEDNFEVAVPVTRGNPDGLYVGRRGVFFTIEGRELDAQIIQVVENPVSFWNQMKAPLHFVRGLITRRFEQMSVSLQKEVETSIGKAGTQVESSLQTGMRQAPQAALPASGRGTAGVPPATRLESAPLAHQEGGRTAGNLRDLMIGVGFLMAGLGTALKFLADTARQLTNPQTLKVVIVMVVVLWAVLSSITALLAWSKLRRRDLGGLLQASGWAINGRLRLTRRMASFFTRRTPLPARSRKRSWYAFWRVAREPRLQGAPCTKR